MKRAFSVYTVILFILLLEGYCSLLSAGQVTLEISTTTGVSDGTITAGFKITNRGTDPAHEVSVLGQFSLDKQRIFVADQIAPGQSATAETAFEVSKGIYGTFPLFITVSYQHADGISASSASLANVSIGSAHGEKMLTVKAALGEGAQKDEILLTLKVENPDVDSITVTGHAPDDLSIEPHLQKVSLQNGMGLAKFTVKNISGGAGSAYGVFFAAEYDSEGLHNLTTAEVVVPVAKVLASNSHDIETLKTGMFAAFLFLTAALLLAIIISSRLRQWLFRTEAIPHLLDISVLLAAEIFIFSRFDLPSLFTSTITAGGDTASHYYTLEHLRHILLPDGKVSGWTMGNYAGFPILQFYFPLPFLIMCLLDLVMPLQVAFKLVTLLGTALLPLTAYTMLRLLRCPFPGPGLGAAFMLPFLFNSANSMWGGNILSTLAGEFSYSLSMALSLVLIGSLYRGAVEDKWIVRNAILVFLVGFSHGYTLLFAEAISLFLLITPSGFSRRILYLFKVYALGFCLLAFWLVPLLVFTKYTTSYHLVWTIHSLKEIVPEILLPIVVAGIGGSIFLLILGGMRYKTTGREILSALAYLWFGLAAAVVFFVAAPRIGVVDIRYVPYAQLMTCFMGALFLGWTARHLLNRRGLNWLLLIVVAAGIMHWTGNRVGPAAGWATWNYEGFEAKGSWPVLERINTALEGDFQDPRVVFEHSQDHNVFGSTRAFESLPLFAGRATLEGLYMQASITAPFIFYIQTLVSRESSQPFPQYSYTSMDFERAKRYLSLFNVRDLILRSREAKEAIQQVEGYSRTKTIGQYELWQLDTNPGRYVDVLQVEPVAYQGNEPWKQVAYQWFSRDDLGDIHLVFNNAQAEKGDSPIKLTTASLDTVPRQEINTSDCTLRESIKSDEILLETTCPGKPHLVKVSYHPDWHVEGADKIYLVSPSFMLIYPRQEKVRLFFGPGPWDRLGQIMTMFGFIVLILNVPLPGKKGRTAWSAMANRMNLPAVSNLRFLPDPGPAARKAILLFILALAIIFVATGSYRIYVNEPYRVYNRSIRFKDTGQYEQARAGFQRFIQTYPMANQARESSYYMGITYYLEKKDREALQSFEGYLKQYPLGNRTAEVNYHIGLILLRSGEKAAGISRMNMLLEKYPGSPWSGYARERLREQGATTGEEQIDINSSNLDQYMGRAISYFNQDRLEEARPILLEISERFPDFEGAPQALAALALCYYKVGDCPNTIIPYRKLVDRYPGDSLAAEAYFHLALCFERTGDRQAADEAYRKVLEIDPEGTFGKQATLKVRP